MLNTCVPGDASAWFNGLRTAFSTGSRWRRYQIAKCGTWECSVHYSRSRGTAPVSDGIKPTAANPSRRGCLILEAKSSAAQYDQQSLYGTTRRTPNDPNRRTTRPRRRPG